jgi:hypothetical protein
MLPALLLEKIKRKHKPPEIWTRAFDLQQNLIPARVLCYFRHGPVDVCSTTHWCAQTWSLNGMSSRSLAPAQTIHCGTFPSRPASDLCDEHGNEKLCMIMIGLYVIQPCNILTLVCQCAHSLIHSSYQVPFNICMAQTSMMSFLNHVCILCHLTLSCST